MWIGEESLYGWIRAMPISLNVIIFRSGSLHLFSLNYLYFVWKKLLFSKISRRLSLTSSAISVITNESFCTNVNENRNIATYISISISNLLHIKCCLYLCISSEFPISYLKCGNHYHYKIAGNVPLFFVQINTGYVNIFIHPRSLSVACPPWPNIIFRVTASWDNVQPQRKMPYDMYMNVGLSVWLFGYVFELWYFLVCHSCSHDLKF